jgi:hypothetical protein
MQDVDIEFSEPAPAIQMLTVFSGLVRSAVEPRWKHSESHPLL